VRGLSETEAGLIMLPMMLISGLVISPVSRRNLVRGPVIAAAVTCLAGPAGVLILGRAAWIGWIVIITLIFGLVTGFAPAEQLVVLLRDRPQIEQQPPAEHLGTASGLLRTFGYVGSIASSAITGIVFHASVSDSGVHLIAWIMTAVSLVLILISVLDRTLPWRTGS
jgi:MFS family permease